MIANLLHGLSRMVTEAFLFVARILYALYVRFFTGRRGKRTLVWGACTAFVLIVLYSAFLAAPSDFPKDTLLRIKKGATLSEVALQLQQKNIVHSAFLFELLARVSKKNGTIVAGEYSFSTPQGLLTIVGRVTSGDFELLPVRIRVQEGMNASQIASLLGRELADFDVDTFYELAVSKEGRLFPDTYFFLPGDDPELVIATMENNFNEHMRDVVVASALVSFGEPIEDVLTMASLLELEAPGTQDRRIIAGILWKRLEIGMPLQVDAIFPYLIGKNSFTLTQEDLRYDSPYNTYVNKGLPPGPIGNPSIDAIISAATPIKTSYLYYLSDLQGNMHYSTTYEQHLQKKSRYLDN